MRFHRQILKKLEICSYWKFFSEFHLLTCKILAILRNLGINNSKICKQSQNWSNNFRIKPDLAKMDLDDPIWPQKCFIWKIAFFKRFNLALVLFGVNRRKVVKNGFYSLYLVKYSWILSNFQVWRTYELEAAWPSGYSV